MHEVQSSFSKMCSASQWENGFLKLSALHLITESSQGLKFKKSLPLELEGNSKQKFLLSVTG